MSRNKIFHPVIILASVWLAALTSCSVPPPPPPQLPYAADLQTALDQALQQGQGPHDLGISAAVIAPDYAPWTGTTGSSHPGAPITPDMRFNMGSIAKTFAAALALQLAEEGVLDLDAPLTTWLPAYPGVDGRITPRQLLNHSSGLFNLFEHPDFPWVGPGVDYERQWQIEEVLSSFVSEPYGRPGEVQHYSSTNFLLLTAVLEQVTEDTVPGEIDKRFLTPLNLDHSHISMGRLPPEETPIAHPWLDNNGDGQLQDLSGTPQIWIASMTHPVLYSTPEEMARWMAALFSDRRVLSEDALAQMLTIPEVKESDPEGASYGLGIVDFSELLGVRVIGHGGSALGYSAAALYLPQQDIALAWSINTGESPPALAATLMSQTWSALSDVLIGNQ